MNAIVHGADASSVRPFHDTTILTCDSPCGAGKTHGACGHVTRMVKRGRKFVIAQPTQELLRQTLTMLRAFDRDIPVTLIDGGATRAPVPAIVRHFEQADRGQPEVVLITHEGLLRAPHVRGKRNWHLIVDEVPQAFTAFERPVRLAACKDMLLGHVRTEAYAPGFTRLLPGRGAEVMAMNRSGDQAREAVRPVMARVYRQADWHVVVEDDRLAAFQRNAEAAPDRVAELPCYGLLQPTLLSGWSSATVMGANLTNSVLYRYWTRLGVRFEPHPAIKPRYRVHPNGGRLTIYHASERPWSKSLRDATVNDPERGAVRLFDNIVSRVKDLHASTPFAWAANNDVADGLFAGCVAVRMPTHAHGLNAFKHLDHAVCLAALNLRSSHYGVLHALTGLDSEEVGDAVYREGCYQLSCRTSLRDPERDCHRSIVVADRLTAAWLAERFPGAAIEALPGASLVPVDGRTVRRSHKTEAAKHVAFRRSVTEDLLGQIERLNQPVLPRRNPLYNHSVSEAPSRALGAQVSLPEIDGADASAPADWYGAAFAAVYCKRAAADLRAGDDDAFVAFLREAHATVVAEKEENFLLSAAHYDPHRNPDPSKERGLGNITRIRGVWMDNDGGDLTHRDFADCFRVRMVVFNSHRSTPEAVRWRCWLPTNRWISVDVHNHLVANILEKLRKRKYFGDNHVRDTLTRALREAGFRPAARDVDAATAKRIGAVVPLLMGMIKSRRWGLDEAQAEVLSDGLVAAGYAGAGDDLQRVCEDLMRIKRHGFDESKFTAASLFYAPCQAAAGPAASFFTDHHEGREAIDPIVWVARSTLDQRPAPPPPTFVRSSPAPIPGMDPIADVVRESKVNAAIGAFRAAPDGQRNRTFMALAGRLAALGLPRAWVGAILADEARRPGAGTKRRAQVSSVLAWLDKRRAFAA